MRLLKVHRGQIVHVYIDGATFKGHLVDVSGDSVSLRDVSVLGDGRETALPGPIVVATASIAWAAVIP